MFILKTKPCWIFSVCGLYFLSCGTVKLTTIVGFFLWNTEQVFVGPQIQCMLASYIALVLPCDLLVLAKLKQANQVIVRSFRKLENESCVFFSLRVDRNSGSSTRGPASSRSCGRRRFWRRRCSRSCSSSVRSRRPSIRRTSCRPCARFSLFPWFSNIIQFVKRSVELRWIASS